MRFGDRIDPTTVATQDARFAVHPLIRANRQTGTSIVEWANPGAKFPGSITAYVMEITELIWEP